MKQELRDRIINYNKAVAKNAEMADDLMTILDSLPPGQAKNLLKDETIGPVLEKYGVSSQ